MKTNLKKAISAVSALALASSLAPATFAAKLTLTDVADTASYATAVNTLVALNVINGYPEDNTFRPDNAITRAEATKVMVAALNQLDAAEGMKGATQFTDVEAKHEWATGFINAGVQAGYIKGMGDGTFAPDANVTYAQMVKMLVSAMGYDEYAEFMGGYPNGYLSIANSEGVTTGVKANANDNVTRAQVAQLVYNALTTPIVENTGMEWTSSGTMVPTIAKMNGQNDNKYKTILTEKFDAYYVEGYVTETSKKGTLKADQVNFGIAKSEKYDNTEFGLEAFKSAKNVTSLADVMADPSRIVTVYVGDTDAADYEGVYAAAIIMVDEYDDNVIISFQPSGKNKTFKFDADLYDEEENDAFLTDGKNYLEIFATESATKTTRYNLQTKSDKTTLDVALYINGSKQDNATRTDINDALINAVGDVELVDTYKTDGYYDALYVNVYETVRVDTVLTTQNKIIFDSKSTKKSLTLDPDKEDLVYNIYNSNGEKMEFSELKKDDVLSIAYAGTDFSNSNHYDIYVSREVVTGKLSSISKTDETVTIGGKEYKFVGSYTSNAPTSDDMGNEYTVYEDYFGRIFDYELNVSSAKYAVIDKAVYNNSDENLRLTMFTADGESKVLVLDAAKASIKEDGVKQSYANKDAVNDAVRLKVYVSGKEGTTRCAIETRVVKYKVSTSTGRVTELDFVTGVEGDGTYKASTGAIGSVKVGDATKVIDAIKYNNATDPQYTDLAIASRNSFVSDTDYVVYGYGDKVDGYHPFVLALEGENAYNAETRFAVIADTITDAQDDAGEYIYKIPAFYFDANATDNTVVKELIASDDLTTEKSDILKNDLEVGDIIVFTTDGKGYIDDFEVIFKPSNGSIDIADYESLVDGAIVNNNDKALFTNKVVALPATNASTAWIEDW